MDAATPALALPARPTAVCHGVSLGFSKAGLSWFLPQVTQRLRTSISKLNNSFIANKRKEKESSSPKHFSPKKYVHCPEQRGRVSESRQAPLLGNEGKGEEV